MEQEQSSVEEVVTENATVEEQVEAQPAPEGAQEVESNIPSEESIKAIDDESLPYGAKVQKKISALTKRNRETEQYYKGQLEAMQSQLNTLMQVQNPVQEVVDVIPAPENFGTTEEYIDALTDYKLKIRETEIKKSLREEQIKTSEEQRKAELERTWQDRQNKAMEKYDDYYEVVTNRSVPLNDHMANAIMESELGPDVAYYLGTHLNEAQRIASLSSVSAIREIGKIEARLGSTSTKKTTQSPSPINPVEGGTNPSGIVNMENLSMKEYIKMRNKQRKES
jgi:hypothetical protein